jgi:hypothetical protein
MFDKVVPKNILDSLFIYCFLLLLSLTALDKNELEHWA